MISEKYVCQCCGGKINRATMTCEYCGTQYKEENNNLIRIETFQNPVVTLGGRSVVYGETLRNIKDTEALITNIQHRIAYEMASEIAKISQYHMNYDPCTDAYDFHAICKVVAPAQQLDDPFECIRGF